MNAINFKKWSDDSGLLLNKYVFKTEKEGCEWGRLLGCWHEKNGNSQENLLHHVCFCINLRNGDVYIDDSKKKIFVKSLGVLVCRIIQIAFKTLFHLAFPVSIPLLVFKTWQLEMEHNKKNEAKGNLIDKHTAAEIGLKCSIAGIESIADILRTPLYGVAMLLSSLAAVIVTPFGPTLLYNFRKIACDYEEKMCENDILELWTLTPCFHPFTNINDIFKQSRKPYPDTDYSNCQSPFERNLSNIARSHVLNLRKQKILFTTTTPYTSENFGEIEGIQKSLGN